MGCCQNSISSFEEQITLEHLPKQDQLLSISKVSRPVQGLKIFPNLKQDPYNFFTLFSQFSSNSLYSRYSCLHSISSKMQDLLVFKKSSMSVSEIQNLINNCEKLSNFDNEHIVKIISVSENNESVFIVTEVCGNRTLKDILENNKIPVGPAFAFARQIMQGLLQLQKFGLCGKFLTASDIFLVQNSLKISISATIFKNPENFPQNLQVYPNPEVWCLGSLILQLLNAPIKTSEGYLDIEELSQVKIDTQDLKCLRKMLRTGNKRPSLLEVVHFNWNSCVYHNKFNDIEKISEVSESFSAVAEIWNESQESSQGSCDAVPKSIEKSLVLQTMESLTN